MPNTKALSSEELARLRYSPQQLGKMIKARRTTLGQTQREAASDIGITYRTLQEWEHGKINPSVVRVFNWLLHGEGDSVSNMWQRRAILAEGTIKDITESLMELRQAHQGVKL